MIETRLVNKDLDSCPDKNERFLNIESIDMLELDNAYIINAVVLT